MDFRSIYVLSVKKADDSVIFESGGDCHPQDTP
jgi:hypothetical protein